MSDGSEKDLIVGEITLKIAEDANNFYKVVDLEK